MEVGYWEKAGAVVVACGGIGALIDFLIGKAGQQRVKSILEDWWLISSYAKTGNFAREEAKFAVSVIDRIAGKKSLSIRRLSFVTFALICGFSVGTILGVISERRYDAGNFLRQTYELPFVLPFIAIAFLINISISVTRVSALIVTSGFRESALYNFLGVISLALTQYLIYCWGDLVVRSLSEAIFGATIVLTQSTFPDNQPVVLSIISFYLASASTYFGELFARPEEFISALRPAYQVDRVGQIFDISGEYKDQSLYLRSSGIIALLINFSRLVPTLVFAASYLFKPFRAVIMVVCQRLIESEKPVFALAFGSIAAFAKAMEGILK